eukprot:m.173194 g.173194  ORF g.173194 m.173194 type:complete len:126 (+) comp13656_c0_seq1:709-1086(+)
MSCGGSMTRLPRPTIEGSQHSACEHSGSCPVCLEELDIFAKQKADRATVLKPCKHTFHRRCIKQWFITELRRGKELLSCPLCRTKIVPKQTLLTKYTGRVFNAANRLFRRGKRTENPQQIIDALF